MLCGRRWTIRHHRRKHSGRNLAPVPTEWLLHSAQGREKDRRKIPRKYQLAPCTGALEEHVIVCHETGSGKIHIAVLVMYEMRHLIKKPEMNVFVFLAPTVALVQQQARVIDESTDFKVGLYCGEVRHLKSHADWLKELEEHEVLVMTPQILLHSLCHCFIRMEMIMLLVFEECRYAHSERNHPHAEIMKVVQLPILNLYLMQRFVLLKTGRSWNAIYHRLLLDCASILQITLTYQSECVWTNG